MTANFDRDDKVALACLATLLVSVAGLVYVLFPGPAEKLPAGQSLVGGDLDRSSRGPDLGDKIAAVRHLDPGQQEEARREFAAKAKQLDLRVGPVSFVLDRIPPGEFDMGSPPGEKGHVENESPVRHIRISKPFYLG